MTDLATTYRPHTFDDVVGQDPLVRSIRKAVERRDTHAFLFTGPSGCGKTTLARIVASSLGAKPANVTEIDAATNSGVDDMRSVADRSSYAAFGGGSRMVIVDECHTLSKQAWQALLKSIEEPPAHLFWSLCTTEPAKVPRTIQTRCGHYEVKPVHRDDLLGLLKRVCNAEGIKIKRSVAGLVAKHADGSPRAALRGLSLVRDCTDSQEAAELLNTSTGEGAAEVIELCRYLVKGRCRFTQARDLAAKIQVPAESARHQINAYFYKCLVGAKSSSQCSYMATVLDVFSQPYPQAHNLAPLMLSLADLLLE